MQDLEQYPKVFLQTGDCFLGVRPTLVSTVLGSCVAVTMCDPTRGIGAICHAFLPDSVSFKNTTREPQVCRFVDTALENMFSSLHKLKVPQENLVVKVFGGASMLAKLSGPPSALATPGASTVQHTARPTIPAPRGANFPARSMTGSFSSRRPELSPHSLAAERLRARPPFSSRK